MLGPFRLLRRAGQGATATVWHAEHPVAGVEVAIKVLTHHLWRAEGRGGRFEREVRALARLDHPAIVRIHDYGWLTADEPAVIDGQVEAGCPYLVMDWHPGGTLADRSVARPFAELRALLLGLLEGLSFAHARGFIHRDLKPGNVLMTRDGPVLSDLGLVYTLDGDMPFEAGICGTPAYMAPEQAAGRSWAFGPWTDLYALGCIAWEWVTGRPPHDHASIEQTLQARLTAALPPLRPLVELPPGFEQWLGRLLARAPEARFRFAADAARDLLAMPDPGWGDQTAAVPRVSAEALTVDAAAPVMIERAAPRTAATVLAPHLAQTLTQSEVTGVESIAAEAHFTPSDRLPTDDWRTAAPRPPVTLPGTGRGLARLRVPPMTGRLEAQATLWSALVRVARERAAQVVCVDGPSGIGKTRLAAWLAHQAHALGVAEPRWVQPRAQRFRGSGLWSCLSRRADGGLLSPDAVKRHLTGLAGLEPAFVEVIAAFATSAAPAPADGLAPLTEREGFVALLEALAAACRSRPHLVIIDDAQLDDIALRFVRYALERRPDLPTLFLLTTDRRSSRLDPLVARRLDALIERSPEPLIELGPLDAEAAGAIIDQRLRLEPTTRDALIAAAGDNPLHAEVILQSWLDQEALSETGRGFRPPAGALAEIPSAPVDAWALHLEHALAPLGPSQRHAIELGAAIGSPISMAQWDAACDAAGLAEPGSVMSALLDADLVFFQDEDHLALRHPLLADALSARARRGGRLARWHGVVADGLIAREARGESVSPERIATHLVAAERIEAALPYGRRAIRQAADGGDIVRWRALILATARSCRALRLGPTHATRIYLKFWWSFLLFRTGEPISAARHARRGADHARAGGDTRYAAEMLWVLARAEVFAGRPESGRRAIEEAGALIDAAAEPTLWAHHLRERCRQVVQLGELELAWRLAHEAADAAAAIGDDNTLAGALNLQGEIARRRDDLDHAEQAYRRAIEHTNSRVNIAIFTGNLALVQLERGDIDGARARAEVVRWQARRLDAPLITAIAELVLLGCAAQHHDAAAWDAAWAGLAPIRALRFLDVDLARTLGRAARAAAERLPERAQMAAALGEQIYRRLGQAAEADALRAWREARAPS